MRYRTKPKSLSGSNYVLTSPNGDHYDIGGSDSQQFFAPDSAFSFIEEEMLDSVDEWLLVNDCSHQKSTVSWVTDTGEVPIAYQTDGTALASRYDGPCSVLANSVRYGARYRSFAPTIVSAKGLLPNSPFRNKPIIINRNPVETGFSAWYLLVDILEIPELIIGITKGLAHTPRDFKRRQVVPKKLADLYLSNEFGIQATLQDMHQFIAILLKWKKIYDKMRKGIQAVYRYHESVDYSSSLQHVAQFSFEDSAPGMSTTQYTVTPVWLTSPWSRTLFYSYSCPEFQGWISRLKQFSDAFGLLAIDSVWDRIPWSFIVDWFYNVSAWLHRHSPRLFPATIKVVDYCETVRLRHHYSLAAGLYCQGDLSRPGGCSLALTSIGSESTDVFIRRRLKPPPVLISRDVAKTQSIITIDRVEIATALFVQHFSKPKQEKDLFF